jgi:hypothetical protein
LGLAAERRELEVLRWRSVDFQRIKFIGQCYYALIDDTNWSYNAGYCTPKGPMTQSNNDFSGIDSTAKAVGIGVRTWGSGVCGNSSPW